MLGSRHPGLIAGVKLMSDGRGVPALYHITVEYAPLRVRAQDYNRASDNAKIMRMLSGTEAYAAVVAHDLDPTLDADIGKKVDSDEEGYIGSDDFDAVCWHQLGSESEWPAQPGCVS